MPKTTKWLLIDLTAWAIIGLLCFCCSPQKRVNRILNKHPELKRDTTITVRDTVLTKHFTFDTLYNYTHTRDTVVLERNNVQVKLYHSRDTIYVSTKVKADTIVKTFNIPVRQVVYTEDKRKVWLMFWAGIAVVLFALVVLHIILKWIKAS